MKKSMRLSLLLVLFVVVAGIWTYAVRTHGGRGGGGPSQATLDESRPRQADPGGGDVESANVDRRKSARMRPVNANAESMILASGAPAVGGGTEPLPPNQLMGFWAWDMERVEAVVTAMQDDSNWSPAVRVFMTEAIRSRRLSPVARNNMANGLLRQGDRSGALLVELFYSMAIDVNESEIWRDFCVQFIARNAEISGMGELVSARLGTLLESGGFPQKGTIFLQLSQLNAKGALVLPNRYDEMIVSAIEDEGQMPPSRVTALGIMFERNREGAVRLSRKILCGASNYPLSLLRTAIGVLGENGESGDVAIVEGFTRSEHEMLRKVAGFALRGMQKNVGGEGAVGPVGGGGS